MSHVLGTQPHYALSPDEAIKPMPGFGADKMHAMAKAIRRRALRLAGHQAARPPHPLNIIGPALKAETEAHGDGKRKQDEPYGTTPLHTTSSLPWGLP